MRQKLVESGAKIRLFGSVLEVRVTEMTQQKQFFDIFNFTSLGDLVKA